MLNNRLCPILKRLIDAGYCYDITTMAYGLIRADVLEDHILREEALKSCETCPYNEYKGNH